MFRFNFFKKNNKQEIIIIKKFLSKNDVQSILKIIESETFETAKQIQFGRNNKELFLNNKNIQNLISQKVHKKLLKKRFKNILIDNILEFYRYNEGDFITMHCDQEVQLFKSQKSNFTAIIYLNDDFIGGETFFSKQNIFVKPRVGNLLLFKQTLLHEAKTVIKGEKLIYRSNWLIE